MTPTDYGEAALFKELAFHTSADAERQGVTVRGKVMLKNLDGETL